MILAMSLFGKIHNKNNILRLSDDCIKYSDHVNRALSDHLFRNRLDPVTVIPAKAGIQTDFLYP